MNHSGIKLLFLITFLSTNVAFSAKNQSRGTIEKMSYAKLSSDEFEKRLRKEQKKAAKMSEKQKEEYQKELENQSLTKEELNLRWQLKKQDESSIQKFVNKFSKKNDTHQKYKRNQPQKIQAQNYFL